MRRGVPVLFAIAFSGCGARTGLLADDFSDASFDLDAVARDEADAPIDSGRHLCPPSPPLATGRCRARAAPLECDYLESSPLQGIAAFCCEFGGWVDCTTVADTTFRTCSERVCTADVYVECVVGDGSECCSCSADMTTDQCGPC
jgi:hypothetical protein